MGVGSTWHNAENTETIGVLAGFEARYDRSSIIVGVQYDTPFQYRDSFSSAPKVTGWRFTIGVGPRF